MSVQFNSRKARANLDLEGFSGADLLHIKKEMDAFVQLASETDKLHIRVSLSLNTGSKTSVRVSGDVMRVLMGRYREVLGLKTVSELALHLEVSRQTVYNWFHGAKINQVLFTRLVEKAPTPELKARIRELKEIK